MDTAPVASKAGKPLPPGSLGLPWIGEPWLSSKTRSLFSPSERREKHGPVFRIRLLGEPVICLTGPDAVSFFYDARYFTRVNASLPPLRELLHPEAIPFLDQSSAHTAASSSSRRSHPRRPLDMCRSSSGLPGAISETGSGRRRCCCAARILD